MVRSPVAFAVILAVAAIHTTTVRADLAVETSVERVFPERISVTHVVGAPGGLGFGVGLSLGESWQLRGSTTSPILLTGIAGTIDLVRGVRVGNAIVWLGATAAAMDFDNCSWGGCGEPAHYIGVGPQLGVDVVLAPVGSTHLIAGIGLGLAYAFEHSDNAAMIQPLGGLRVGLGW